MFNSSCIPFYSEAGFGSLLSEWGKWLGAGKEERVEGKIWMQLPFSRIIKCPFYRWSLYNTICLTRAVRGQKGQSVHLALAILRSWPRSRLGHRVHLPVQYWGKAPKWHWKWLKTSWVQSGGAHSPGIWNISKGRVSNACGIHQVPQWRTVSNRWDYSWSMRVLCRRYCRNTGSRASGGPKL